MMRIFHERRQPRRATERTTIPKQSLHHTVLQTQLALMIVLLIGCSNGGSERGETMTESPGEGQVASQGDVALGLDVVQRDGHAVFENRAVGLLVHGASQSSDGTHAIDVFRQRGYQVKKIFSPEHGLRGTAAAGEKVEGGVDPETGLPVISLYGPRTAPEPQQLADIDVLAIDLQDVGVRFYTYVSTMLLSAEAAINAGLDIVILDRPNPLGGVHTSGLFRDDSVPRSMVSRAPGTLVHGLTMGEIARVAFPLARLIETTSAGRVYVVSMEGWRRDMRWPDVGKNWINPSPNLRSFQAASLYPTTALLESTNVSEGRGTETPFLTIGAPWFDDELIQQLGVLFESAGVEWEATKFTPVSSSAAPQPKYVGELCNGLQLSSSPAELNHYGLGLRLLAKLSARDEFQLRREGEALTWLLGAPRASEILRLRKDLDGQVESHLEAVGEMQRQWLEDRREALLYE